MTPLRCTALVATLSVIFAGPTWAQREALVRASESYRAAQIAFAAGDFNAADRDFALAYQASRVPEILFNRALCAEERSQWQRAIDFYNRYLAEREVSDAAAIRDRIAVLAAAARSGATESPELQALGLRGALFVGSDPPGATVHVGAIGGASVGKTPTSLRLAGEHRVFVELGGYVSDERLAIANATDLTYLWFELEERDNEISAPPETAPPERAEVDGGFLRVGGDGIEGAKVYVDGDIVCERGPCRVPVAAGSHSISFRRDGFKSYQRTVVIQRETETTVTVELAREPGRADAITAYAVAGAFLGAAIYSSLEAAKIRDDLEQRAEGGAPPLQSDDERLGWTAFQGGKFWAVSANAAYGLSAASLILAVYYTFRDKGPPSTGESSVTSLSLTPVLDAERSGLAFGGRF